MVRAAQAINNWVAVERQCSVGVYGILAVEETVRESIASQKTSWAGLSWLGKVQ